MLAYLPVLRDAIEQEGAQTSAPHLEVWACEHCVSTNLPIYLSYLPMYLSICLSIYLST